MKTTPPVTNNNNLPPKPDSVKTNPPVTVNAPYKFNAAEPQYVVLLLNKVDPVFCNEAKNAFMRFNRNTYYNKTMSADLLEIDPENKLVLMAPFKDAQEAMTYIESVKPKTATEIIPWLKGGKYSFVIMSEANLEILKVKKDPEIYKAFLNQYFPGKF